MHHSTHMDRKVEVTLWDKDSPRSFWQILPEPLVRQIENLWNGPDSYLLGLSDPEIFKEAMLRGKQFAELDYSSRNRFWVEYARFLEEVDHRGKMSMPYVLGRSIHKETFYKHFATEPIKLAFILRKPARYEEQVETILHKANEKLREILDLPYKKADGSPDMQIVNKFLQIQESLKREMLRLKYKDKSPKERAESEEPDEEVVEQPRPVQETREQKIARLREMEARANSLPGQPL